MRCSQCGINLGPFDNQGNDTEPLCFDCSQSFKGKMCSDNNKKSEESFSGTMDRGSSIFFNKQMVFSFSAIAVLYLLQFVPIPFISLHYFVSNFGSLPLSILRKLSPFALGITPYLTAVWLLLFFSGFIPYLKGVFSRSHQQYTSLSFLTYSLTIVIAIVQSLSITLFLISIKSPVDGTALISFNPFLFSAGYMLLVTLGTIFISKATEIVTSKGFINGVVLLIACAILFDIVLDIVNAFSSYLNNFQISSSDILIIIGIIYVADKKNEVIIISGVEKKSTVLAYAQPVILPFRINSCGLLPLMSANAIKSFLQILPKYIHGLTINPYIPYLTGFLFTAFFSVLWIVNHYSPLNIIKTLNKFSYMVKNVPQEKSIEFLDGIINKTILPSVVFSCLLYLIQLFFTELYQTASPLAALFRPELLIGIVTIQEIIKRIKINNAAFLNNSQQKPGEWKCIYSAETKLEADIISDILANNSIQTYIQNTSASAVTGTTAVYEICNPAHPSLTIFRGIGKGKIAVYVPPESVKGVNEILDQFKADRVKQEGLTAT